ncbi:MAG: fatty acid desaturase [Acidimicrobiales bacterium]
MAVTDAQDDVRNEATGDDRRGRTTRREAAGSLRPVLDIIPAEAYENPTWKGMAYLARDVVMYVALVVALIVFSNPLVVVPLWVGMALVISGLFVIGHDAGHQALFASKRLNDIVGRIVMLPSWHVYEGWVLGHNRIHHSYTVRQGYDFVWHPYTPDQFASMSALGRLRHRIEWSWFGAGAYYLREVWWNKMIVGKPPARWVSSIRKDRILVWSFVGVASALLFWLGWSMDGGALGGLWMVARVLVVPFLAFCFVIGSFVHVHHIAPDIRWWPKREWTVQGPGRGHDRPPRPAGHGLLHPLDHGARPAPRGHAHPDVQPRAGGERHQGRVPRRGTRGAAAVP